MALVRHYRMSAAPGKGEALQAALLALAGALKDVRGVESVEILRGSDEQEQFVFIEKWASADDQESGAASVGAAFGPIMAAVIGPPEGTSFQIVGA